ncbi:hypothetical protein [Photobacterium leiognathi]|uniref:hypothetical protein n=1 Tax=Photobacterium leiognathi TaxID=553611 RepID=UPI0015E64B21|nr:hypothetical protein [Photobacterium leiognathi]
MDKKHHAKQTRYDPPLGNEEIAMVYSNWVVYPVRTHHKNKKGGREYIAVPLLPNWRTP